MAEKQRTYGKFVMAGQVTSERADDILGCRVELDAKGKPDLVSIQFRTTEGFREIQMDFIQAMFVLSGLKCIQLDTSTPFPDDPRGERNNPLC